jgi:Rieske Fe-S protein
VEDGAISCPCHGSRFDPASGKVVSGPASRALAEVAVTVRDGAVYTA